MKDTLKAKIEEKIEDIELELILLSDRLEVMNSLTVSGQEASTLAGIIQQISTQLQFGNEYITFLKKKYLNESTDKE